MYTITLSQILVVLLAFAVTLGFTYLAARASGRAREKRETDRLCDEAYRAGLQRGRSEWTQHVHMN